MIKSLTEKNILYKLSSAILTVFGDYDKELRINRVVIKYRFLSYKIKKIIIYSSRPGLIIGKHGRSIDALVVELKEEFGYKIEVELKEYEPLPILSSYSIDY